MTKDEADYDPAGGTHVSKVWWDGEKLMAKPIPLEDIYQPVQEPWNPSDTAHRPGGLPQDFTKHEVDLADAWSEWVCPASAQYFMKCCDCGLVHEMQFKVAKYSEGDECEFVADADLQAVFRARRATPPAAQPVPVQVVDIAALVEGMEVSIDVSTGDHDSGNRLFGSVTMAQENQGSKHGLILLVQDPEANFKTTTPPAAQPAIPDALTSADIQEHIEYVAGWNDCRQAMLEMMK
jgi:hypothetical protein